MSLTENTYPYASYIKSPSKLGSSPKANALSNNVKALAAYVNVLVSGNSKAQTVSGPLGNRYFMDSGGKCKDSNGVEQTRYVYINNVPDGNIPFISSAMGENMTSFEGLVPGVLGNAAYINPFKIFKAFSAETPCQKIKMPIRDISNNVSIDSKYVCESDILDYNPCWFSEKINPVTKEKCKEGMTTQSLHSNDMMLQLHYISYFCLGSYILFRLIHK
jgi:hypothetical protein